MRALSLVTLFAALGVGCATRAPTKYELDRRAGLASPNGLGDVDSELAKIEHAAPVDAAAGEPKRIGPRVERVWVYDHELPGGQWIQGTHVFLEVEPGRWADGRSGQ